MDWDPNAPAEDGYICPPCPVFHPTSEEFQDPLKYISSIRHIGAQAGICKIVPPAGWRPPFAINEKTFRFRTRVQQLNCIEGHSRAEGNFVEALRMFLYRNGIPMQELPRVDGQLLNLHLLYKTVKENGGYDQVCAQNRWEHIVRKVGRTLAANQPPEALCQAFQKHYEVCLLAYERHDTTDLQTPEVNKKKIKKENGDHGSATAASTFPTPTRKTSSSMKKHMTVERLNRRQERDNDGTGNDVDDEDSPMTDGDGSPASKRVKRTLFSDGENINGENNGIKEEPHNSDDHKMFKEEQQVSLSVESDKQATTLPLKSMEPLALKPAADRNYRLEAPEIHVGQQFYQFFPQYGAVLAEVKRVLGGKKPHVVVQYLNDKSRDTVDLSTMQILVANGWDPEAAELAFKSEICQTCLRGDCWDKMLLCDSCNGGHHLFCLDNPLQEVPTGDWYCDACVKDSYSSERDTNPKFGFEMGSEYNLISYKEKADAWKKSYFELKTNGEMDSLTDKELEQEYWRLLSIPVHEQRLEVEYGSDVDSGPAGSGFPRLDSYQKCVRFVNKRWRNVTMKAKSDYAHKLSSFFSHGLRQGIDTHQSIERLLEKYAHDNWNLNNLPKLSGSVLQHLDEDINGVMVPWIYMGMSFSTFCWHVEDHNFYSISYVHCGAPKTWYGIPCDKADLFEETMKKLTPELFGSQPDLHLQLVTMFSPQTLIEHGVPVYRATHRPNEFIVTFPSAYHAGFNNGFNCAEAVNFATVDWLPWGAKSVLKYRKYQKLPVFSHDALVCSLAETFVESNQFDFELAQAYLLPAMQQLYDEYMAFEQHISSSDVTRRELMADYEQKYHGIPSTSSDTSTMRRSMAKMIKDTSACDVPGRRSMKMSMSSGRSEDNDNPHHGRKQLRTAKMTMSTRPTRMVLWAGQSGKHEGLRCVTCKQYCYLQAVVCTRCRHQSSVGCIEHYTSMCSCDKEKHYVYLYRFESSHLMSVLSAMQDRLSDVEDWTKKCDAVFPKAESEQTVISSVAKPDIRTAKALLAEGVKCGGASRERLDAIEFAIKDAVQWTEKAERLLHSHSHKNNQAIGIPIQQLAVLIDEANRLSVTPDNINRINDLLSEWHECKGAAESILESLGDIKTKEAAKSSSFDLQDCNQVEALWHDNKCHQGSIQSITSIISQIKRMGVITHDDVVSRLENAKQYLDVLCAVNDMIARIAKNLQHPGEHSPGSELSRCDSMRQSPVMEGACRALVDSADALHLDQTLSIFKVEILRSLLKVTETESIELCGALEDYSKSTEELDALLNRLKGLPVCPNQLMELSNRLEKCKAWERRARELINLTPVSGSSSVYSIYTDKNADDYASLANRLSLDEADAFYEQADTHFVPASSLIRRQLHGRIQDCHRWYSAVHSLFVKSSNNTATLQSFFEDAMSKLRSFHERDLHPHSQLHCICEQVLSEKSNMLACQGCKRYFHPQCVDGSATALTHSLRAFMCLDCRPKHLANGKRGGGYAKSSRNQSTSLVTTESSLLSVFCLCRGVEDSPMICCDFCDEWYHARCIGMTAEVMNQVEAYRCQRCAIRQNLYYFDKKTLRKDYLGRHPALCRVETLITQLQTTLIALPSGTRELLEYVQRVREIDQRAKDYVQSFATEFSVASTFSKIDYHAKEKQLLDLMSEVTDVEVSLDSSIGSLGAIHWCLRACQLVLTCASAPKYSQLVVLLNDTKQPNFTFPRVEYYHIQLTIEDRVDKATLWLKQVKLLEVEEWNVERARRLYREYQELRQFLELPTAEVELVHRIAQPAEQERERDEYGNAKRRRLE